MGFSPWAAVPARKPSLCGLSTGYKETAFITMVYRLQGISVSEAVAYPYLPCSLIWVFAGLFLSRFHHSCLSQGLYSFFPPFFKHLFTEAASDHLKVQLCPAAGPLEPAGIVCVWQKAELGPSHRYCPCRPDDCSKTLEHQTNTEASLRTSANTVFEQKCFFFFYQRSSSHSIKCCNSIYLGR